MENEAWDSSSDGSVEHEFDLQDNDEEDHLYISGSIPKLQFRKIKSKARWDEDMGMAEVIEKKGGMWATTGIVRQSKVYCSIEETLFLVEQGALLLDDKDMALSLIVMHEMVAEGKNGCSRDSYETYRHLKELGYIVGHHGVRWSFKTDKRCLTSIQATEDTNGVIENKLIDDSSITELLQDMQIIEVKPTFDVYLPNSKFRKSSPGEPNFMVYVTRSNPPSEAEIASLERCCSNGTPLKYSNVEDGRVSYFEFERVELPMLP